MSATEVQLLNVQYRKSFDVLLQCVPTWTEAQQVRLTQSRADDGTHEGRRDGLAPPGVTPSVYPNISRAIERLAGAPESLTGPA